MKKADFCEEAKKYWQFYDWAEGLSGIDGDEFSSRRLEITTNRFDAPINLFFVLALQAAAEISHFLGDVDRAEDYQSQAERTKQKIHKIFWCKSKKAYQTYVGEQGIDNHFCEQVQALAVITGVEWDDLRDILINENNGMVKTTISQSIYKYQALFSGSEKYNHWAYQDIHKQWSYMLDNSATCFWETIEGASDFDGAGSLCHGWSAIPAYFLHISYRLLCLV